jgi:GT2 family glycosyltransferase/glycosyltransferase involved in cell wall biosynthesis
MNDQFAQSADAIAALNDPALAPLFWRPSRLGVLSAWYGHVPFAHWIVAAHRPASIVELGTHWGVSYAAFCEAVLRGQLDARCMAVDSWQGDEHAGFYGSDVLADLRRFHDGRYGAFSTLKQSLFDEALSVVPDGSVDLLHIDGRHHYEDVSHDFATWRAKLSDRAVVLFHDTNVRENDFGVWRLWSELAGGGRSFEFLHCHGLGVLAVGAHVGPAVLNLCALSGGEVNSLRERFATLGERWMAAYAAQEQQARAARLEQELAAVRQWGGKAQAEVNRLFPLYRDLLEAHRGARASLAQARYDLAAQAHRMQAAEAALARFEAEAAGLAPEAEAGTRLASARAQIDALRAERLMILGSTSWRVTAPLRRLAAWRRGPGATPPEISPIAAPAAATATPSPWPENGLPRALFISGEGHTPGTIYRVERYTATARACGFEARFMPAAPVGPADLDRVRLVVLWREPHSAHIDGIITVAHEQGATVIYDVDDLMFRPELAVIDIIDGIRSQKFSELETQAFFARIGRALKACDLVTCPTEELARHARRMGKPAYVLPNGFDRASRAASRAARRGWSQDGDDLLRIGYAAGSRTHQRDFAVAAGAVARILRENDKARLTVFRDPSSGEGVVLMEEFAEFVGLEDRIEWRDMVGLADLPGEIARFAVNIAPLEADNPFCEAKSELKYFEAALVGVPTVASPSGPYRRAITDGVTGRIARHAEDWHACLRDLLADAAARRRMAMAAYHDSLGRFGEEARARAFSLMLAQIEGGAAGAAAFERERYRASLPRPAPPTVPDSKVLFENDRGGPACVTVIVPVYNYADFVLEALPSIADQTISALDLVVIDDASPDDSARMVVDWARGHAHRFNRMVVLRHDANAGLGFARNSGFAAAESEFVLPVDADNRLRPQACATLLARIEAAGAAFAYPSIQEFGTKGDVFGTEPYSVLRLQRGNYIDAMALVRKSAWASVGGYDHVQYGWEDYDFWCRLAEYGQFGVQVPEILADYRVHRASMLHTMTEIRHHKNDLVADLKRRHPWVDVPRKDE